MTEPIATRIAVGAEAPAFEADTLAGGRSSLADLQNGHHLVLHFMREFT